MSTPTKISLGNSVLEANGLENANPIITGNYIGPNHELPLPWPDGDWYLRQTFVPAVCEGETVICHTLIPGLLDYYRSLELIPDSSTIIAVEPTAEGENYGFPGTDPLEILRSEVSFSDHQRPNYLCSTFGSQQVAEQAADLGLQTINRADSSLSNNKARLREAAEKYGFSVLPGTTIRDNDDIETASNAVWNAEKGVWLKFPTGSGGDLVVKIEGTANPQSIAEAASQLRSNVQKAFKEGRFQVDFDSFWPIDRVAPAEFPLVIEADASINGEVVANGSTQFMATKLGEISIIGHHTQITTVDGEYLGNEPYADIDNRSRTIIEEQAQLVAHYNTREHEYFGIAAIDWFLTKNGSGQTKAAVVELNSRPTANTPPIIIADKLGAPHFINTNAYTDRPIHSIDDFLAVVGNDLAYGDILGNGLVIPQAFRTLVRRQGTIASPNFKLLILGRDSEHCHDVIQHLAKRGVRFEP